MKRRPERTVKVVEYETGRSEGHVDIVNESGVVLYRFRYNKYNKPRIVDTANALAERQKGLLGI